MSLKLSLEQLKILYRLNFAAAIQQENDTWYDANGRIIFTNNRSLTGVGFSRTEWENAGAVQPVRRCNAPWDGVMKHAPAGYVFARTIMDDTMPGGPVERTIEYVAPFDRWQNHWKNGVYFFIRRREKLHRKSIRVLQECSAVLVLAKP